MSTRHIQTQIGSGNCCDSCRYYNEMNHRCHALPPFVAVGDVRTVFPFIELPHTTWCRQFARDRKSEKTPPRKTLLIDDNPKPKEAL